jgi:hypothetical protein
LSQAREWRERFRGIGWWDSPYDSVWPTVPALADQLARLHFSTDLDDLDSYWIFCCRIVKRDFGIKEVKVNKRAVDVGWRQDPVQYLVGTRQSIIFFNLNRPEAAVGRIADLLAIDCSGDRYRLQFKNVMLEFAVAAKGASLGNILMAMGEDPGVKVIADRNIREQNSALGRFQSTLRSFLHDVATGAGARWRG